MAIRWDDEQPPSFERAVPKTTPDSQPETPQFHPYPSGPTIPYRDPPIPGPSYRQPKDPSIPMHDYGVPGEAGARSGINPRPSMPQQAGGNFDFSTPEGVRAYFQSRGVTPYATSPDYWAQKWQEFGQRDPAYYQRFLSNAEEFTGGPDQTARAMGFQPRQPQGGGLGWLLQLLGSRLQQPQGMPALPQAPQAPSMGTPQVDINAIIQQALRRTF